MDPLSEYIVQVPIRHNVISALLLAGIIQGVLLILVIIFKPGRQNHPVRIISLYVLVLLFPLIDHYLCCTGLMSRLLHLTDSTESFVLLIGSGLYFLIRSVIYKSGIDIHKDWKHFIIPALSPLRKLTIFIK